MPVHSDPGTDPPANPLWPRSGESITQHHSDRLLERSAWVTAMEIATFPLVAGGFPVCCTAMRRFAVCNTAMRRFAVWCTGTRRFTLCRTSTRQFAMCRHAMRHFSLCCTAMPRAAFWQPLSCRSHQNSLSCPCRNPCLRSSNAYNLVANIPFPVAQQFFVGLVFRLASVRRLSCLAVCRPRLWSREHSV